MKTHTTFTLRKLILNDLNAEKHKITEQEISVWTAMLPEITKEMFEMIHFFVNSIFQKKLVVRQIRQIQQECIMLLDHLEKHTNLPANVDVLKSSTIKCLDLVLEKVLSDCSSYITDDVLMPIMHLNREKIALASDMSLLLSVLQHLGADGKLQKLIVECMSDLLKSGQSSYSRMGYVKKFQQSLIDLCKVTNKQAVDQELITHLLRMHYNTAGFIKYYQQKVEYELAACIEVEEQFKYLQFCANRFGNPHYRKSTPVYDPKCRRVDHILYDFVKLELSIRNKRAVQIREEFRQREIDRGYTTTKLPEVSYRIRTTLSVGSLAYLIRLMVQGKVIEPGVRTELLAFVAGIFQTPSTGITGISAGSFGVRYKQVTQSSARTIRVLLVRMLKILDEEFEIN